MILAADDSGGRCVPPDIDSCNVLSSAGWARLWDSRARWLSQRTHTHSHSRSLTHFLTHSLALAISLPHASNTGKLARL